MRVSDADRLRHLADQAAALVEDGMALGLGSGSTAEAFVAALGRRVREGLRVTGVATSCRTEAKAIEAGIPLTTLNEIPSLDLGVDGADEIDPYLNLLKGRGGALLYEKIVAGACEKWVIVAAAEKQVDLLGTRTALPVEVVPFGWEQTARIITRLGIGLHPKLRTDASGGPFITDGGHYILDCNVRGGIADPHLTMVALKMAPGVVDHGLFLDFAHAAMIVDEEGTVFTWEREPE
jgi:ribose 5-phosphate isomerase A